MIGNPKWFTVRKYTGWGLTPNCWQGWAYILAFVLPFIILDYFSFSVELKNILTTIWVGLLLLDIIYIMFQVKKDERERLHEAIADRNALWFMIFVLIISVLFTRVLTPIILITLLGATIVKSITHFYLRDK